MNIRIFFESLVEFLSTFFGQHRTFRKRIWSKNNWNYDDFEKIRNVCILKIHFLVSKKMGNDHSTSTSANMDMKARRSLDASMFNKAKHSCSTPRSSVALPGGGGTIPPSPIHRTSTDYSSPSPRRSISEQMGNNVPSRRMSRATIHLENSISENVSFVDALHLSPHQVQLLVSTWPRIKSSSSLFTQVFKLLMTRSPVSREMFQKMSIVGGFSSGNVCDLNSHAKLLNELLDSLMADLHQPAKIVQAKCQDVGAAHVNMNEKCCGTVFDQLGECFTELITKVECVRSKREAVKSWMCVVSYVVDSIKSGYMEEWAKKRRGGPTASNGIAGNNGQCPYSA
ncbi:unnamed protein product [Caenorhabditis angaria]|uniref:Globin domain-containing protein n=1 Tax=Caenorhabditis angaria TaxID=860376 RepID=A0A9P1IWC7_9PELO|nr:unnamed protein product [Caenorhabditis angaria]